MVAGTSQDLDTWPNPLTHNYFSAPSSGSLFICPHRLPESRLMAKDRKSASVILEQAGPLLNIPGADGKSTCPWGGGQGEGGLWHGQVETKRVGFSQNGFWVHLHQNLLGICIHHAESWHPLHSRDVRVSEGETQEPAFLMNILSVERREIGTPRWDGEKN